MSEGLPLPIGISGQKRAGKDTLADYAAKKYEYEKTAMSFPLKKVCCQLFGLTMHQVEKKKEEIDPRWGVSPRQILQKVGTDFMRESVHDMMPDLKCERGQFWITLMRARLDKDRKLILSDVRFPDEAELIKEYGGITIHINRGDRVKPEHISEAVDFDTDYVIDNNGTKAQLYSAFDDIVESYRDEAYTSEWLDSNDP